MIPEAGVNPGYIRGYTIPPHLSLDGANSRFNPGFRCTIGRGLLYQDVRDGLVTSPRLFAGVYPFDDAQSLP